MILEKILLGITLGAPVGPVTIEIMKRALNQGFWSAFKVRVGASFGNTIGLIVSYFSLASIQKSSLLIGIIGFIGSGYLIFTGIKNIREQSIKLVSSNNDTKLIFTSKIRYSSLLTGFLLSVANPYSIIFWLSIFASSFDATKVTITNFIYDLFIILGVTIWGVILSLIFVTTKTLFNEHNISIITKIAGLLLCFFGLKYMWFNIEKIFF